MGGGVFRCGHRSARPRPAVLTPSVQFLPAFWNCPLTALNAHFSGPRPPTPSTHRAGTPDAEGPPTRASSQSFREHEALHAVCAGVGAGQTRRSCMGGREGAALRAGRTGQQGDCIRAAGSVRHPGWEVQTAKLMGEQCSPRPEFSERSATPAVNFTQREHKLEGEKLPEVPTENPSCRVGFLEQQPHL